FGLEDPFVWAAGQRDALDLADLHGESEELGWADRWPWLYVNAAAFWSPGRLWARARRLAARYPTGQVPAALKGVRRWARKVTARRGVPCLLLTLAAALGAEGFADEVQKHQTEARLAATDLTAEDTAGAERWLSEYAAAPAYRHLVLRRFFSRDEARA